MTTAKIHCEACSAPLKVLNSGSNVVRCDYCGTENVLSKDVRVVIAERTRDFRARLMYAMIPLFDLDDIEELIINLDGMIVSRVDYDNIPGRTNTSKIRELILFAERHCVLQELVDCVIWMRPNIDLT